MVHCDNHSLLDAQLHLMQTAAVCAVQEAVRRVPGAFVSPCIDAMTLAGVGVGIVAQQPIAKDTLVFRAPRDVWYPFSAEFALIEAQQKAPGFIRQLDGLLSSTPAFRDRSSFVPNAMMLGTHLAMASVSNENTTLVNSYIPSLPEFVDLPFYWDEVQFQALDGCQEVRQSIRQSAQLYFQLYQHLFGSNNQVVPPERFFWSISVLMSRASSAKDQPFTLIPFFDLFNHADNGDECIQQYDHQQQAFVVHTTRDYAEGEQLFINYGRHGNTRLLRNYGFTTTDNQHDTATLTLPSELQLLDAQDSASSDKVAILNALGVAARQKTISLTASGDLTPTSHRWLQLRLADVEELQALIHQVVAHGSVSDESLVLPTSLATKMERLVEALSQTRLRQHKHSIADDEAFLAGNGTKMAPWLLGATRVRLSEKRILTKATKTKVTAA